MARILLVMRHGKSRWDEPGLTDHDRGLTKRGKRDSRRMGKEINARGIVPDVIISSTAKRARSTARRVAKASGYSGDIVYDERLYFGEFGECIRVLSELDYGAGVAMLIGHNPTLEEFVSHFAHTQILLPTAALACIDLPIDVWYSFDASTPATLRFLLTSRELDES